MSNNSVANSVAFLAQNPISIPQETKPFGFVPRYSVNDYVKHMCNQSKRGIVINVDPSRFSYFGSKIPAYLVGWEDGDECWVSAGSIRKLQFVETKPECNGGFTVKETAND